MVSSGVSEKVHRNPLSVPPGRDPGSGGSAATRTGRLRFYTPRPGAPPGHEKALV